MVTERNASAQLKTEFAVGTDENGETILSVRSFGDMDPAASTDNILKTAKALAGISDYEMQRCLKSFVTEIFETV